MDSRRKGAAGVDDGDESRGATQVDEDVTIAGAAEIKGSLVVPQGARGIVIFAHGSGSGRFSPRNRFVAEQLNARGIATLLVDLLTESEGQVDEITAPASLRYCLALVQAWPGDGLLRPREKA